MCKGCIVQSDEASNWLIMQKCKKRHLVVENIIGDGCIYFTNPKHDGDFEMT